MTSNCCGTWMADVMAKGLDDERYCSSVIVKTISGSFHNTSFVYRAEATHVHDIYNNGSITKDFILIDRTNIDLILMKHFTRMYNTNLSISYLYRTATCTKFYLEYITETYHKNVDGRLQLF